MDRWSSQEAALRTALAQCQSFEFQLITALSNLICYDRFSANFHKDQVLHLVLQNNDIWKVINKFLMINILPASLNNGESGFI